MKINLDSLPLISHTFFGFLLMNFSLKLHYKNIHTTAHGGTTTLSETLGLFAILLVVQLPSSSPLIIFSPHSSNLEYSFPPFTQSRPINVSQLVINSPPLTKSLNLSINPISLTQKQCTFISFMPYKYTLTKILA